MAQALHELALDFEWPEPEHLEARKNELFGLISEEGLCRQIDADSFFPDKGEATKLGKEVCMMCYVRLECAEFALLNDERFGIWGGFSETQRRKLRRQLMNDGGDSGN